MNSKENLNGSVGRTLDLFAFDAAVLPDVDDTAALLAPLVARLEALGEEDRIALLNHIRSELHKVSPMRAEPVDCVLWIKSELVHSNSYNPNLLSVDEQQAANEAALFALNQWLEARGEPRLSVDDAAPKTKANLY